MNNYKLELPQMSTTEIKQKIVDLDNRIKEADDKITSYADCVEGIKNALKALEKEIEFEVYSTGMANESLSDDEKVSVSYFKGYIEEDKVESLKNEATDNSWGLIVEDPSEDDDVPTKLQNNKFVALLSAY